MSCNRATRISALFNLHIYELSLKTLMHVRNRNHARRITKTAPI